MIEHELNCKISETQPQFLLSAKLMQRHPSTSKMRVNSTLTPDMRYHRNLLDLDVLLRQGVSRNMGNPTKKAKVLANENEVAPTLFIIDWDDTLNPSTWCMRRGMPVGRDLSDEDKSTFRDLEAKVARTMLKCIDTGFLVIVTNAENGWVEQSSKLLMPKVWKLLDRVPVISARSSFEHSCRDAPIAWKSMTFAKIMSELITSSSIPLGQPLRVVSIGDSNHEREALFEVSRERIPRIVPVSVKLMNMPNIHDLSTQHDHLHQQLDNILSGSTPRDIYYKDGSFVDFPARSPAEIRPPSIQRRSVPRKLVTAQVPSRPPPHPRLRT